MTFNKGLEGGVSKYDWSHINSKYNWVAKDSDGRVEAYRERPTLGERWWYSSVVGSSSQHLGYSPPWESDSDWKESLEERPDLPKRYRLHHLRWTASGIIDTTTNHDLTLGEALDLLNERGEA